MLTRLYLDNFRCFVNFEYRPPRKQLIVGANGSGKSTMLVALLTLRNFATSGESVDKVFFPMNRTRWMNQPDQTWEIEVRFDERTYAYRLVIEFVGDPLRPRVKSEGVHCDDKPIFELTEGEVHLFNDRFEQTNTFPFDPVRSGLPMVPLLKDYSLLTRFRMWMSNLHGFRLNPFAMEWKAEREDATPTLTLQNFAAWYRHLVQTFPRENAAFLAGLAEVVDEISYLRLAAVGENAKILMADLSGAQAGTMMFNELSDGQRCLIGLYAILHFVLARGGTVILDEPDNFVSLREIQPWLTALEDTVENGNGQALIISHHPEFINQWAPGGVRFYRDGSGPVRVEEFRADGSTALTPAELVARGWERE